MFNLLILILLVLERVGTKFFLAIIQHENDNFSEEEDRNRSEFVLVLIFSKYLTKNP
jgi:hypothetical protein